VYFTTIVFHALQILQKTKKLFRTVKVNTPTAILWKSRADTAVTFIFHNI